MPHHIYKKEGKRNWWIDIKVKGRKRIRRSSGTTDEKKAKAIAKAIEAREWERLTKGDPATLTFSEAVMHYIADGRSDLYLAPLVAHFKDRLVAGIGDGDIKAAAVAIYPGRKPATWNRQVLTPARAVINHAASKKLAAYIKVKSFLEMKPVRKAPPADWLPRFLPHAEPRLAALALFMRVTAARIGQATALEWSALDLARGLAIIPTAKNHPERVAELTPQLVAMLANLDGDRQGRVFGFSSRWQVYGPWKAACAAAGIPYVPTHRTGRRAFATTMARSGIDAKTAAVRGGWKSVRLMLDIYTDADETPGLISQVFGDF
jgi:integrase